MSETAPSTGQRGPTDAAANASPTGAQPGDKQAAVSQAGARPEAERKSSAGSTGPTGSSQAAAVAGPAPAAAASGASTAASDSDSEPEVELLQYKVVVLGDGAVGKSSIITRLCVNNFAKQYKQTLGLDIFKARVELPGGIRASLQIWDVGGQTIGSRMIENYVYAAQAVVLVYDVTNPASFHNLEEWLGVVKRVFKDATLPYIAVVGNKMDLTHLRAVKAEKHAQFADEANLYSFLISARLGDLVTLMFRRIAADLAGVVLTRAELEVGSTVIPARIVNHPQHDPAQRPLELKKSNESQTCAIA